MKLIFGKTIIFLILISSFVFAGGIEEDSGPEEISDEKSYEMVDEASILTTSENTNEYLDLLESKNPNCYVTWAEGKYVNDPNLTSNENYATWC
jgi:hypothetical protein